MGNPTAQRLRRYVVRVDFLSDGDRYARETYTLDAANLKTARAEGLLRSEGSVYDDPRIPDFGRIVSAECARAL